MEDQCNADVEGIDRPLRTFGKMEKWNGRVALVTGASSGIGAAVCKSLVKSGMKVVGTARRVEKIQEIANELKGEKGSLIGVKCDVAIEADIYDLFKTVKEAYGGVDVCVNIAGIALRGSLLDGDPEDWRRTMNVNVIALCLCSKLTIASMRERGVDDGHIINLSSIGAHMVGPFSDLHFYIGTKFAVRAISEGLRQEMREANSHIRVSAISPGYVKTEFFDAMYQGGTPDFEFLREVPLLPEDIAATFMHILSAPPHVEINDVILRPALLQQ